MHIEWWEVLVVTVAVYAGWSRFAGYPFNTKSIQDEQHDERVKRDRMYDAQIKEHLNNLVNETIRHYQEPLTEQRNIFFTQANEVFETLDHIQQMPIGKRWNDQLYNDIEYKIDAAIYHVTYSEENPGPYGATFKHKNVSYLEHMAAFGKFRAVPSFKESDGWTSDEKHTHKKTYTQSQRAFLNQLPGQKLTTEEQNGNIIFQDYQARIKDGE